MMSKDISVPACMSISFLQMMPIIPDAVLAVINCGNQPSVREKLSELCQQKACLQVYRTSSSVDVCPREELVDLITGM